MFQAPPSNPAPQAGFFIALIRQNFSENKKVGILQFLCCKVGLFQLL